MLADLAARVQRGGNPGCAGPLLPVAHSSTSPRALASRGLLGEAGGEWSLEMPRVSAGSSAPCLPLPQATPQPHSTLSARVGWARPPRRVPRRKGTRVWQRASEFRFLDLQNDQEESFGQQGEPLRGWGPESPTPSCWADSNCFQLFALQSSLVRDTERV